MSPAPKKPAAPKIARAPRAAKSNTAATATKPAVTAAGARSPVLAASTGEPVPGGSSSAAALRSPAREHPSASATSVIGATMTGPTPGAPGPLGANLDEQPWPAPVQIERVSAAPLETGLSDYAFWVEYFADHEPQAPPAAGFRRGRIWA